MKNSSVPDVSAPARIREIAEQCVQCGLCLPACPTYQVSRSESESPRGRIAIARSLSAQGPVEHSARQHLDSCLACGACERACPSHVPYLDLLATARARMQSYRHESGTRRIMRAALERPNLMGWFWPLARRIHPALRKLRRARAVTQITPVTPTSEAQRHSLALLSGCSGNQLEAATLTAAAALLARCDVEYVAIPPQCCGALAYHSGDLQRARQLGDQLNTQLRSSGARACTGIVSGCARHCAQVVDGNTPYQDLMEMLWSRRDRLRFRASGQVVALHTPCTERLGEGGRSAAERLLALVPELSVVVLPSRGRCCGSAGTHFIDHPAAAAELARLARDEIKTSRATMILSSNIGCRVQLLRDHTNVQHPLEFLHAQLESPP